MPALAARTLVFLSSAAVLVLELLAARLLIPYVGNTLETYTAIIGVILAGIALGTWLGGRAADRRDPRGLIAPLLVAGGTLAAVTIPIADALGGALRGAGPATTTTITAFTFLAPAAVLSAITPAVIKLQLASVEHTGRVVGQLSALSTVGGIVGTFVTGFVLVGALPTRTSIRGLAAITIASGIAIGLALRRGAPTAAAAPTGARPHLGVLPVVLAGLALGTSFVAADPCEIESRYFCASVREDPERPSGRALVLDTLRHSYVDLADPTHLEFTYTAWFGDVIAAVAPDGRALTTLHIGGGGFTMPRYLREVHPGSTSTVLELDPMVVDIARTRLGLEPGDDLDVRTGDARLTLEQVDGPFELVIGDAFGGLAVPWHLTTTEFAEAVAERMAPGAVMVLNVIDHGELAFLRAEVATLAVTFEHVAVLGRPGAFGVGPRGGNHVVIVSDRPLPTAAILAANAARGRADELLTGDALTAFFAGARVLTDDDAPVDQLLTPRPRT
jgi:spermidine synthase